MTNHIHWKPDAEEADRVGEGEKEQEKPGLRGKERLAGPPWRRAWTENGVWGQMRKLRFSKVKLKLTQQESGSWDSRPRLYDPSPALDCCAVLGPAESHGPAAPAGSPRPCEP